ncbi:carbohydrate esterase family 16 protein [Saccharata proteae CBS 121410]|uniref:Carbohydrate esterase family 16 protein n=1 Tax=Saccharata proteae CBS 121410 TaxID=1314787 RepID=A0A9P4I023_9PEZI|nr:carbohydrate esterase family 16 protein [Saccharata proteae CBS 121410]
MKALRYLFVFGDSYTISSFNIGGSWPSLSNPLGNPPFPGYTTSGGVNWLGHLVSDYNATDVLAWNLASGGATVDAKILRARMPNPDAVLSFVDQVNIWTKHLSPPPPHASWTPESSLFTLWFGMNDVGNDWHLNERSVKTATEKIMWQLYAREPIKRLHAIMDMYWEQVSVLYTKGARMFALMNTPPIHRTPAMVIQYPEVLGRNVQAAVINQWNDLLEHRVAVFSKQHPDAKIKVIDTSSAFNTAIDDPKRFGAPDATSWDYKGQEKIWWDSYHPGKEISIMLAEAVAGGWGVEEADGGFFKLDKEQTGKEL